MISPQEGAAQALVDLPAGIPVVAVEAGPADAIPVVAVDQFGGAESATRCCSTSGTGPSTTSPARVTSSRPSSASRAGARRSTAAGVEPPPFVTATGARGRATSSAGGWPRTRDVTAVFVANDQMALGFLRALHERGRAIPGSVSIVGFDDIPEAQYFTPPLTTVRQDFGEMGRSALRLMLDVMEETSDPAARLTIAPELVVRRSTGPPPA